jgi:ferritin
MLSNILITALQEQQNRERYNAAFYRALADQLEAVFWPGSAAWMKKASDEEQEHADKFSAYLIDRGSAPLYAALPMPTIPTGDNLVEYFLAALVNEQINTEAIKELYFTAQESEDPQTCTFLIWALDEQTSAERELNDILLMLRRLDKTGWLAFDNGLK